ncbi:uncharacterized protein TNCV_3983281 [Trichonephila clavipes]|nr:uncharacterized protein TNCV_3983281 [Trichonephila clavipes]
MSRNSELSDFEKGVIVGNHRNGRFLRDISSELYIPRSPLAFVIKKWKVGGDCRNVLRPHRPTKLRDRNRQVLSKEIRRNRTKLVAHMLQEFQQASRTVLINTIRKEAHLLGFHGHAAA